MVCAYAYHHVDLHKTALGLTLQILIFVTLCYIVTVHASITVVYPRITHLGVYFLPDSVDPAFKRDWCLNGTSIYNHLYNHRVYWWHNQQQWQARATTDMRSYVHQFPSSSTNLSWPHHSRNCLEPMPNTWVGIDANRRVWRTLGLEDLGLNQLTENSWSC